MHSDVEDKTPLTLEQREDLCGQLMRLEAAALKLRDRLGISHTRNKAVTINRTLSYRLGYHDGVATMLKAVMWRTDVRTIQAWAVRVREWSQSKNVERTPPPQMQFFGTAGQPRDYRANDCTAAGSGRPVGENFGRLTSFS